jgi:hypothetical protein
MRLQYINCATKTVEFDSDAQYMQLWVAYFEDGKLKSGARPSKGDCGGPMPHGTTMVLNAAAWEKPTLPGHSQVVMELETKYHSVGFDMKFPENWGASEAYAFGFVSGTLRLSEEHPIELAALVKTRIRGEEVDRYEFFGEDGKRLPAFVIMAALVSDPKK